MTEIGRRGRRLFLCGAGGFTLALPLLPSLLRSKKAEAQAMQQKRFIGIGTTHGGVPAADMFPADEAATETQEIFPGHVARYGELPYEQVGDRARISPVLSGAANVLTPSLASKINVIRGLGITRYVGHHFGCQLGNFAYRGSGAGQTIDQTLAWSPNFYRNIDGVVQRSIHVDSDRRVGKGMTWGYANPEARTGELSNIPPEQSSRALFERLFGSGEPEEPEAMRTPVVDRVLAHYQAMRAGRFGDAARISRADQLRLDAHMDRLSELQRSVMSRANISCGAPETPERSASFGSRADLALSSSPIDLATNAEWYGVFNDVIVAAIMCNVSSVATIYARSPLVDGWNGSDWHEQVAHAQDESTLAAHVQSVFEHVFLDLVAKLDVEEADGRTFLDNSHVQLTNEHGTITHFGFEIPVVTAGGAGERFETGRFVDYRYRESTLLPKGQWTTGPKSEFREGLTLNQYFANVAMAMDLDASEWRHPDNAGYGAIIVEDHAMDAYHGGILDAASDPLPFLARFS